MKVTKASKKKFIFNFSLSLSLSLAFISVNFVRFGLIAKSIIIKTSFQGKNNKRYMKTSRSGISTVPRDPFQ